MSQKTNKSFAKRLRVTKNGKVLARKPGFNHFNAKQKRRHQYTGKVDQQISLTTKDMQRNLPHSA